MVNQIGPAIIRRHEVQTESGTGLGRLLKSLWLNRGLVADLTSRHLRDINAGQIAGGIWLVVHPLFLLAVYAFLFGLVLNVRIGDSGPGDYTLYLFAGLVSWFVTQDAFLQTVHSMTSNASLVRKVAIPLETLIAKTLLSSFLVQLVLVVAVIVVCLIVRGGLPGTLLLLPPLIVVHFIMLFGAALLLASVAPYFRDLPELVRMFCTINIFLIPAIYMPDWIPVGLAFPIYVNPFSHLVWCYQDIFYFNEIKHPMSWGVTVVFAFAALVFGSSVFVRLRHHLASVL